MSDALVLLNTLSDADALTALLRCCGSTSWAMRMVAARPFDSVDAVLEASEQLEATLDEHDWREAFATHPRIGGGDPDPGSFATTRTWSAQEQVGMSHADTDVRQRMARVNDAYYERFGYVFLICATGCTAAEMLEAAEARLGNDPDVEFRHAIEQQRMITRLRLHKLCEGQDP